MSKEEIAAVLRKLRILSGLTAEQVGSRLGKSGKSVNAWENGRGQPDLDTFFDLLRLYGVIDSSVGTASEFVTALCERSEDLKKLRRYREAEEPTRAAIDALLQLSRGERVANRRVIAAFDGGVSEHTFYATDQEISDAIREDELENE